MYVYFVIGLFYQTLHLTIQTLGVFNNQMLVFTD